MKDIRYVYHPLSIGLVNEIQSKDLMESFQDTLVKINALDKKLVEKFADCEIAMTHLDDILELLYRRSIPENIKCIIDDVFDKEYETLKNMHYVPETDISASSCELLLKELLKIRYINLVMLTFMPTVVLIVGCGLSKVVDFKNDFGFCKEFNFSVSTIKY